MSSPFSSSEIRDLISKLEKLERWQSEAESSASASKGKGYSRGDPKARAAAARPAVTESSFPAIAPIARNWKLYEEAGPPFIGQPFRTVEEGPGPVPALVEDQALFVAWDQREGLQRVHLCYSAGFWARVALETFTDQLSPFELSSPHKHTIVLRSLGLGGAGRFVSPEDFEAFCGQSKSEGRIAYGFATFTELEVFCQGARLQVPAAYQRC